MRIILPNILQNFPTISLRYQGGGYTSSPGSFMVNYTWVIMSEWSVICMTEAAQQRIINVVKDLPDDAEGAVINFMLN